MVNWGTSSFLIKASQGRFGVPLGEKVEDPVAGVGERHVVGEERSRDIDIVGGELVEPLLHLLESITGFAHRQADGLARVDPKLLIDHSQVDPDGELGSRHRCHAQGLVRLVEGGRRRRDRLAAGGNGEDHTDNHEE